MTTDSLNAGIELDEEASTGRDDETTKEDVLAELIFKNPVDGQTPVLDDDVVLISNMTRQHDEVEKLEEHVTTNQNFEQSLAAEAHALTGDFITPQRPLNMFTSVPTRTGLGVALEALQEGKKNILVRLYEKIKAYIVRLIEWIGSIFTDKTKQGDVAGNEEFFNRYFAKKTRVVQGVLIVQERKEDLFSRLNDILERKNVEQGIKDNVTQFGQKLIEHFEKSDSIFQNFREKLAGSPVVISLLSNSDTFKQLKDLTTWTERITEGIQSITEILRSRDRDILKATAEEAQADMDECKKEFDKIRGAIDIVEKGMNQLYEGGNTKYADKIKTFTIEDLLEDAHLLNKQMSTDAFGQLVRSSTRIGQFSEACKKLLSELDSTVKDFDEASVGPDSNAPGFVIYHKLFREVFEVFSKSTHVTAKLFADSQRAVRQSSNISAYVRSFVDSLNRYVVRMMATIPESVRDDVKKYLAGIGFDMENITDEPSKITVPRD